jgi:hypothetical protein
VALPANKATLGIAFAVIVLSLKGRPKSSRIGICLGRFWSVEDKASSDLFSLQEEGSGKHCLAVSVSQKQVGGQITRKSNY